MIALLCFVLTVLVSPFKSKSRLEAENAVLRHQVVMLRRMVHRRVRLHKVPDSQTGGDLLALQVALAPCVIGYAEIAARLAARPEAHAETNPYRGWIAEYAGAPYQAVAAKARAHLERLAESYSTPAREAELIAIFKEATRLEIEFWEMGWRASQRGE